MEPAGCSGRSTAGGSAEAGGAAGPSSRLNRDFRSPEAPPAGAGTESGAAPLGVPTEGEGCASRPASAAGEEKGLPWPAAVERAGEDSGADAEGRAAGSDEDAAAWAWAPT